MKYCLNCEAKPGDRHALNNANVFMNSWEDKFIY